MVQELLEKVEENSSGEEQWDINFRYRTCLYHIKPFVHNMMCLNQCCGSGIFLGIPDPDPIF
jgi:hypothetical protein